jgi:TetR/AcrR family transcriptional repressor of nem operon
LDAAMKLFWEKGYEAAGLTELLRRMRISRQSLYDTFGDKRSLYQEALDHYMASFIGRQVVRLETPASPLGNVRAVLKMYEHHATSGNGLGCLLANGVAEFGSRDAVMAARLRDKVGQLESAFRDCLRRAQIAGELPADADVPGLARTFVMTAHGVSLLGRVGADKDLIRDSLRLVGSLLPAAGTK